MIDFKFETINSFSESELEQVYLKLNDKQKEYVDHKTEDKRRQSLGVRVLLLRLLTCHNMAHCFFDLCFDVNGAPILKDSGVYISFSHSQDLVACAISDTPVGIDIEHLRAVNEKVLKRVCTSEELEYINSCGEEVFFEIWTAKEACKKALGITFSEICKKSLVSGGKLLRRDGEYVVESVKEEKFFRCIYYKA